MPDPNELLAEMLAQAGGEDQQGTFPSAIPPLRPQPPLMGASAPDVPPPEVPAAAPVVPQDPLQALIGAGTRGIPPAPKEPTLKRTKKEMFRDMLSTFVYSLASGLQESRGPGGNARGAAAALLAPYEREMQQHKMALESRRVAAQEAQQRVMEEFRQQQILDMTRSIEIVGPNGEALQIAPKDLSAYISAGYRLKGQQLAQKPPLDQKVDEYTNEKGQRINIYQKPDGSTYEKTFGKVFQKATPGVDEPLSPAVEAQRRRIALAGATQRAAEQEPLIEEAAKALVEPRNLTALKDIASLRSDQRLKIFARAKQLDPKFDPGLVNQRIRFLQAYEDPKGRASINRQAINNILQHAGDLSDLNKQYSRTDVRFLNKPINMLARQFGSEAYVNYATTLGVLRDELTLYFAGGYAPVEKQHAMWNKILTEEATPGQVEAFAKEIVHLGLRRATTFNSQFRKNMGYDDPNMIVPEAAEAGKQLGLGSAIGKFGSGGQLTGASGVGASGGRKRVLIPDGKGGFIEK